MSSTGRTLKIAGVVILYNPDSGLTERIDTYLQYLDKLYILDNSEPGVPFLAPAYLNNKKVHCVQDNENKGISVRLNTAASMAQQEGYEWLLTMDQDSFFPEDSFPSYLQCVEGYGAKDATAMFGVLFGQQELQSKECTAEEVEQLITSGSIVNLKLFHKTAPFDEALFIDRVDQEYCLRARLMQYRIVRFNNIYLQHNLGITTSGISFKNLKSTPRALHSPVRLYYMFRNYLYLKNKYAQRDPASIAFMKKELLLRIKNNLIYGKQRVELLKYLYKALSDYRNGRMGKIRS